MKNVFLTVSASKCLWTRVSSEGKVAGLFRNSCVRTERQRAHGRCTAHVVQGSLKRHVNNLGEVVVLV